MSRIGFIGTGHIAAPMVRHLAGKGHDITVTRRNAQVSETLAAECGVAIKDPQGVLEASDIVFLSLRPKIAESVLDPLTFQSRHRVVSVMAGVSSRRLGQLCFPVTDLSRTIPLGFLETGGCPLATFGNSELLGGLFAPENPVVSLDTEDMLNAHFAVVALVPGMLDLLDTASGWLAARTGDAANAEFFATQLLTGFLSAMDKGPAGRLAEERDALATGGTLSLEMVEALRSSGATAAVTGALDGLEQRLGLTDD